MAKKSEVLIHNAETGKIITRDANSEELAQIEIDEASNLATQIAKTKVAADKVALLARLGLTEDEFKTILG